MLPRQIARSFRERPRSRRDISYDADERAMSYTSNTPKIIRAGAAKRPPRV
jgi:hypothetical protein